MSYRVNSRMYETVLPLALELAPQPHMNYVCDLNYLSVIDVLGDKAAEFLQGQLSCDVRLVSHEQIQQGVLCNLKGRILGMVDVLLWQGIYRLVVPGDLVEETIHSLQKMAAFSRVRLEKSSQISILGFYQRNETGLLFAGKPLPKNSLALNQSESHAFYSLDSRRGIVLVHRDARDVILAPFRAESLVLGTLGWHHLTLMAHCVSIYPETRGVFLPHRLDLHKAGYLSFDKGCYKGQEIIARMHYRATQKHTLKLLSLTSAVAPRSGQRLVRFDGQTEYGELVDYCPLGGDAYLIAASVLIDEPEDGFMLV